MNSYVEQYKENEMALLGGLFLYPDEYSQHIDIIKPEDFNIAPLGDLFADLKKTRDFVKTVDMYDSAVDNEKKVLAVQCTQALLFESHMDTLLGVFYSNAKKRRIKNALEKVVFFDNENDIELELEKILEQEKNRNDNPDKDDLFLKQYEAIQNGIFAEDEQRFQTGFSRLDNNLNGLRRKTVSIVGAKPSTGKTAFALNIARNNIKTGKVLFFSLEMSIGQLQERLFSEVLSLNFGLIIKKKITDEQNADISKAFAKLMETEHFYIIDDTYSIEQIALAIAEHRPDFVVIDFMQIVTTQKRCDNRRTEIDHISQEIKRLAKKYNCHIMVLSQVARGEKGKKEPTMSDLKESGGLEQDGDYIMLLHRPYVLDKEYCDKEETIVLLDKNKYGLTGRIKFKFEGHYQRFSEVETRYD